MYVCLFSPHAVAEYMYIYILYNIISLDDDCFYQHPLFRSLQSTHKGDTYTKCFKVENEHGPRQPWHDIHSAARGPEAMSLARSFEERWIKQANAGDLVNRSRLGLDNDKQLENGGGWCAQLSRSIDSRVNAFDPSVRQSLLDNFVSHEHKADWTDVKEKHTKLSKRFETATFKELSYSRCLDTKKGRLVDNSIHTTNVHHIRRAKHFIYIESQYFMGSSHMWAQDNPTKCVSILSASTTSTFRLSVNILSHLCYVSQCTG